MKDYYFEYCDQRFLLTLFLLLLGLVIISILTFTYLLNGLISPIFFVIITIGLPVLIFFLNKKKIKKMGYAKLYVDSLELYLSDNEIKIDFKDVNYLPHPSPSPKIEGWELT